MSMTVPVGTIPDHVPAELVREFMFETVPGADRDAVLAVARAARSLPDIFYSPQARRSQGGWIVTSHSMQREVFQDGATFSSRHNADFSQLIGETWPMLPLEADGAEHLEWRKLLNPVFSPARMAKLEGEIEQLAADLVDGIAKGKEVEFVSGFSAIFPVQIFLRMFGLPLDQADKLLEWENLLLHSTDIAGRQAGARRIVDYMRGVIADRRAAPTDDLISYVATASIHGRPLTPDEMIGVCFLLYSAGLDTVTAMLGFIFKHLAEHPDHQKQLRDDPSLIPAALEELLRAYPIIISGRHATRDIVFHGVEIKRGDEMVLPMMLAGRDGEEFEDPDRIDFARKKVDHITFAAGPHRCIGSHLARRELKIALETWLARIPPFRIAEGQKAVTSAQGVFGVTSLPLAWD